MNKEEYYKRIEKINNRSKTDRVSADEEYQLVCQRNYLSTKYIESLEQKCKKQKEINQKAIEYIKERFYFNEETGEYALLHTFDKCNVKELLDILNEVSE